MWRKGLHKWLFTLNVILFASIALAGYRAVAYRGLPALGPLELPAAGVPPQKPADDSLRGMHDNLLAMFPAAAVPPGPERAAEPEPAVAKPKRKAWPDFPLHLRGVIYRGGAASAAFVWDRSTKNERCCREGDQVAGWRIERILPREVVVARGGEELSLTLALPGGPTPAGSRASGAGPRPGGPAPPSPPAATAAPPAPTKRRFDLRESAIAPLRADPSRLLQMGTPQLQLGNDGRLNGICLSSVAPGSLLESIGFSSGDVVKAVNGVKFDDLQQVLDYYRAHANDKSFTITVRRGGREFDLVYQIRR